MDESGLKGLEEERRLAYVGITRAQRLATVSFAANRRVYNQWQSQIPSRFIDELPAAHVEVLTPPGLYGGGFGAAAPRPAPTLADAAAKADVYNSPGWRRMQTRAQTRPVSQPQEARNMVIDAGAVSSDLTRRDSVGHGVRPALQSAWTDGRARTAGARPAPDRSWLSLVCRRGDAAVPLVIPDLALAHEFGQARMNRHEVDRGSNAFLLHLKHA
jgi:hypothetical protein